MLRTGSQGRHPSFCSLAELLLPSIVLSPEYTKTSGSLSSRSTPSRKGKEDNYLDMVFTSMGIGRRVSQKASCSAHLRMSVLHPSADGSETQG